MAQALHRECHSARMPSALQVPTILVPKSLYPLSTAGLLALSPELQTLACHLTGCLIRTTLHTTAGGAVSCLLAQDGEQNLPTAQGLAPSALVFSPASSPQPEVAAASGRYPSLGLLGDPQGPYLHHLLGPHGHAQADLGP